MAAGTGRQGDWDCPACGRLVFAKKSICGKCKAAKPASLEIVTDTPLESVTLQRGSKERGVGACAGNAVEGGGGGGKGVVEGGGVSCVSVLNSLLKRKKVDKGEGDTAERRQHAAICGARVNASEHPHKKIKTK